MKKVTFRSHEEALLAVQRSAFNSARTAATGAGSFT